MIRPEIPSDIPAIHSLLGEAFGQEMEGLLVNKLRTSDHFISEFSLVLELSGELIGYLLLYPINIISEKSRSLGLALAPMAVHPQYQNKGWGSKLVAHSLKEARSQGWGSVVVLGHAEYYPRFGFKPASQLGITGPFEVPDEVFMAIELLPGSLASGGKVVYPKPFMDF